MKPYTKTDLENIIGVQLQNLEALQELVGLIQQQNTLLEKANQKLAAETSEVKQQLRNYSRRRAWKKGVEAKKCAFLHNFPGAPKPSRRNSAFNPISQTYKKAPIRIRTGAFCNKINRRGNCFYKHSYFAYTTRTV